MKESYAGSKVLFILEIIMETQIINFYQKADAYGTFEIHYNMFFCTYINI